MAGSMARLIGLCHYHRISVPDAFMVCGFGAHSLLDKLDKKIGVDTRNGVRHDPCCGKPHGLSRNQVGTRIRLHEEYIRTDVPSCFCAGCFPCKFVPCASSGSYSFWLGREG